MTANYVKADFEPILAYGTQHAGIAAQVAGAAAADSVSALASAVPMFGLIGQDFLLAFAGAQGSYLSSAAEIAAVHAETAVSAASAVATYSTTELASATTFLSNL
ncbi:type VII secretion target [Nocardia sp. NBC_01503]|uniref:type VII secretion target n=1 Tax=Nocardia sp. NBC_01503 TaxID=2975997 RepID=UPI002E7BE8C4|nr:type VII secretion target [Nocardia sp. NBC_01503]WTL33916.1 type VII secretion target [Nocardia sp. NBC_01503]